MKNLIIQIIALLQTCFAYILIFCLMELCSPQGTHTGHVKIALFLYFVLLVKVEPHPTNLYNPFVFSAHWRSWIENLNKITE